MGVAPVRLTLIDDDAKLGQLLQQYLKQYGFELEAYTDPEEGLPAVLRNPPALLILDLMLPGKDGFQVCREIRAVSPLPIVMLTARGETNDRIVGLELGADDYLPKPFEPRELVARIQAVLRRKGPQESTAGFVWRSLDLEVNETRREVRRGEALLDLTAAEFDLLVLLLRHAGRVLDRDAILSSLHGEAWDAYSRTVDVTLSRLRAKLGDEARQGRYIKSIRGAGYRWVAPVEKVGGP
jgi:DNA-binding response OmpR family regulator